MALLHFNTCSSTVAPLCCLLSLSPCFCFVMGYLLVTIRPRLPPPRQGLSCPPSWDIFQPKSIKQNPKTHSFPTDPGRGKRLSETQRSLCGQGQPGAPGPLPHIESKDSHFFPLGVNWWGWMLSSPGPRSPVPTHILAVPLIP